MNIVVLDGYALNPGDLEWKELEALGPCRVFERTAPEQTVERAKEAEILLTNKTVLDAATVEQLPKLKFVSVLATGYNVVDTEFARQRGVAVANVPTYSTRSVAQLVFAHVLNLAHHAAHHAATVTEGRWSRSVDFCYWDYPLIELAGMTMGIVGFGRIGRATTALATAFGMKVLAYDVLEQADVPKGVEMADLDAVFTDPDVVSLHCPLTAENQGLVDRDRLATMKPSAWLINTSRGPLVDEAALADALNSGRLAGTGLDVLCSEPPKADNPLLTAKNCYITPHIAWATGAARARLLDTSVENIKAFLEGRPQNVVNS